MLRHPWLKGDHESNHFKKEKKLTEVSECRKRTTISSHKSKEKEQNPMNVTGNMRKLTETCQENNLKLELKMIRQSPLKLNSTYTHRKERELIPKQPAREKQGKKEGKCNVKVLDLLKAGLKQR